MGPWLAAVAVLGLLTVLPGPDVAVVTRFALQGGTGQGARASYGVVCGLLIWGALTVAGLSGLLAASATAYTAVRVTGAVFLVVLGVQTLWRSRPASLRAPAYAPSARPLRAGLLTNLLNPKIAVFYTSLLPQLAPPGVPTALALSILVAVHSCLGLGWLLLWSRLIGRGRALLNRTRVREALERLTGTVLVGVVLRVAWEAR